MSRIDRLIKKARPKPTILERLAENNPYWGETDSELLDYLSGENYQAPERGTFEWSQFMYALIHAPHEDNGIERGEEYDEN